MLKYIRENLSGILFIALLFAMSCKTGEGCPTKQYQTQVNRRGEASSKHGKSSLFPKSMSKQIYKN